MDNLELGKIRLNAILFDVLDDILTTPSDLKPTFHKPDDERLYFLDDADFREQLDAFLQHIEALGLTGYTRANVSTGIGAKHILYNLAESLLDEGDTIAFATPYWTTYVDIADIVGAKTLLLPAPAS